MSPTALAKQPELAPVEPQPETSLALVIERLAANPQVDVTKLEKIIELQERVLASQAVAAFNAAYAKMQSELPEIDERGKILVKGSLRSTYAKLEDIHAAVKPVMKKFGFAIRHRTEWPADRPNVIRIVGVLSHEQGHAEESSFEAPMDKSEYRTDIQSMGSTVSYGRRYTTLDLLNIATRNVDNDGQRQQPEREIKAPAGFDSWWTDIQATADEGTKALEAAWAASTQEFRDHAWKTNRDAVAALKKKAAQVKA